MKRFFALFAALIGLLFGQIALAENIDSFDVDAVLGSDRVLDVTETIKYDFGNSSHHGIFRLIPETYQRNGAQYRLRLDFIGAALDGNPVESKVTYEGDNIRIRLGDPDRTITGSHVYTIHYATNRAVNDFPDDQQAELYWNVTGNGWEVPINASTFTLKGPSEPSKTICYTGVYGSTEQNCTQTASGQTLTFKSGPLGGYEGMTIAVRYPDSVIRAQSLSDKLANFIEDNLWLFFPVLVFVGMFVIWYKYGKDPRGRGTVIALYEEPRGLSPLEMSALQEENISPRAISATLVDLARRGYAKMKFEGDQEGGWFKKASKIYYVRGKEADSSLKEFERTIYNGIFEDGDEIDLSERNTTFYKSITKARAQAFAGLKQGGWYQNSPASVRAIWIGIAVGFGWLLYIVASANGALYAMSAVLSGFIIAGFGWQMPKVTREGAVVREEIEGFRRFLSVTETKRLEFTDAPSKKPEQFARFLPAAVTFGVEKQWAGQFADMQLPQPDYMQGHLNGWTAYNIASAVDRFHDSSASHLYAPPSSAGSGGSGFSGGGSGGGFGGGGGGSW